jgi:hypothetical protein
MSPTVFLLAALAAGSGRQGVWPTWSVWPEAEGL